jgi:hypothetical protein
MMYTIQDIAKTRLKVLMSVSSLKMEVADQVASARAAPATKESNKWPAGLSRAGTVAMSATSLLFAWLAAGTLRRCGSMDKEAEVFSGVLWGLSPLIWAYLYSWTAALSPVLKQAHCNRVDKYLHVVAFRLGISLFSVTHVMVGLA